VPQEPEKEKTSHLVTVVAAIIADRISRPRKNFYLLNPCEAAGEAMLEV
jgi:hypothetical protein